MSFPNILLAFSLFGFLITVRHHKIDGYFGEKLVKRVCTISKEPRFLGGGKVDVRIAFKVHEMNSELWIVNTAIRDFRNMFPNPEESLKLGDTVEIKFPAHAHDLINNPLNNIPVIGLKKGDILILNPDRIYQRDSKRIRWGYGLSISGILLGVMLKSFRKTKGR